MDCDSCAIKNLVYEYAHAIDDGDLQRVAALFAQGRIVALDQAGVANEIEGSAAVLALYSAFTRLYADDGTPHTIHMTSSVKVEVEPEAATARAKSYAVVFQAVDEFPLQPVIGVRYYDLFEKGPQGWHFSERKIDTRLVGDLSKHLLRSVDQDEKP